MCVRAMLNNLIPVWEWEVKKLEAVVQYIKLWKKLVLPYNGVKIEILNYYNVLHKNRKKNPVSE